MGNKIITEKDFWICTLGNVPAQLQGTREGSKKKSGEKYITVEDKATSSWIDFGCKKYMLLMAIVAAVLVVGAVVLGVVTVATGGAALIAIGALAGLAGAAIGAVMGGLLCGQKMGGGRKWLGNKKDLIIQGSPGITGGHQMKCKVGGVITFAPHIKNWSQAVSLGAANYIGGLMEGMMAGAAIGMGGAALSGGSSVFASAGWRGLGRAALNFGKSIPTNLKVNFIESFSKFGLGMRGVMGVQNTAATYGNTGEASVTDFAKGTVAMETGAYDSAKNIATGQGTWQDWVGMAMMIAPVGQGKRELEDSLFNKDAEGRAKDAETTKDGDSETAKIRSQDGETPAQSRDAEAFEMGLGKFEGDPARDHYGSGKDSHPAEWQAMIDDLKANGVEIKYREGNLAYSPEKGRPGQMILDPDASYSALKHEYQHYLDDKANEHPGFSEYLKNQDFQAEMETNAYNKEIELANEMGNKELANELEQLKQNELNRIYGRE